MNTNEYLPSRTSIWMESQAAWLDRSLPYLFDPMDSCGLTMSTSVVSHPLSFRKLERLSSLSSGPEKRCRNFGFSVRGAVMPPEG